MSATTQSLAPTTDRTRCDLPVTTKFRLGPVVTDDMRAFLDTYGFLHLEGALNAAEVQTLRDEQDRLEKRWIDEDTREINGIPLFFGKGRGDKTIIHRMPFSSMYSDAIRNLILDARFEPLKALVGEGVRVGHDEKDGVVMNRYVNAENSTRPQLGWHTDGLRCIAYGRMPQQMLNFGLHLDRITEADGGLRLIPGTHKQGFFKMVFYKPYFVWHRPDKNEITVETQPGDLTVHDGRLWHRVARASRMGAERRSLYVPYQTGPVEVKGEKSKTPFYHYLGKLMRWFKGGR